MQGRNKNLRGVVCVITLAGVLTGCGGGSTSITDSNPPGGNSPPEKIQGVDTPSSVSVVTATNAD